MNSPNAIPSATVILPYVLREKAGNHKSLIVAGSTVREIIDALDHNYPGLGFNLCYETGDLRPFVNIFLNRENIRYLQGLETPVQMGATIYILQSVAGGCS
jgi:molybdopterin synthase sulfur carrier subunit